MPITEFTNLNWPGVILTCILILMSFTLPRRYVVLPVMLVSCFLTQGQQLIVFGAHFSSLRIIIFFTWVRLILRREVSIYGFNILDKVIIVYVIVSFVNYMLVWQTGAALMYRLGTTYNIVGLYFLFRCVLVDIEDIELALRMLSVALVVMSLFMIVEYFTARNVFSVFGGVPEITTVREGAYRCEGPFRHPILAGTLGGCSLPLLVGLYYRSTRYRRLTVLSIVACLIIIATSASSGPVVSCMFGILALLLWPWRRHTRLLFRGFLVGLVLLQLIMKAPIWFVMTRAAIFSASTGWYRAHLIDQAVFYLHEWWLIGTNYTAHWMPQAVLPAFPSMADITNQYILEGVEGGILKLILFVVILAIAFKTVGQVTRRLEDVDQSLAFLVWSFGAAFIVHTFSFISISYFDQIIVFWFLHLASIGRIRSLMRDVEVEEPGLAEQAYAL